jgi:hypothetical protein
MELKHKTQSRSTFPLKKHSYEIPLCFYCVARLLYTLCVAAYRFYFSIFFSPSVSYKYVIIQLSFALVQKPWCGVFQTVGTVFLSQN